MGNQQIGGGGLPFGQPNKGQGKEKKKEEQEKRRVEPPAQRVGRKKKKKGADTATRLPNITPSTRCRLRLLKLERVKDYLLMEQEFIDSQEKNKPQQENAKNPDDDRAKVDELRGTPMMVGNLEEFIDENHVIVSGNLGPEYYTSIFSFVDKDMLEPGSSILMHSKTMSVVGIMEDEADPLLNVMKVDKAPLQSYADIGGLEDQIQEIKEAVELPLTHPEIYEEMGIKPPKGVILYGEPGTGKTLLAKAVANETSATFLRVVGSELIQKYLGEGPKLVRELFRVAEEHAPSIIFIDEVVLLEQRDTTQLLVVRMKFKEPCLNFLINWMVLIQEQMLKSLWLLTKLKLWILLLSDLVELIVRLNSLSLIKRPRRRFSKSTSERWL